MQLTVVVIFSGRHELLKQCVESVLAALPVEGHLEVIVNGDFPESVRWLEGQDLVVHEIARTSRCNARNHALARHHSDLIYFLDDDVVVPKHLFELALSKFRADPELAILGGPNLTPPESTFLQKCFGAVVTSFFCAPKVRRRYEAGSCDLIMPADQHDLILCNFVVRRALVWPELQFVPDLTSNEENIFVFQGQERGLKIGRLPALYVFHARRPSLKSFLQQVISYGTGRGEQMLLLPRSNHPFFVFVLGLPLLALLVAWGFPDSLALAAGMYAFLSLCGALFSKETRALGVRGILSVALLTPLVHAAYCGSIWRTLAKKAWCLKPARPTFATEPA